MLEIKTVIISKVFEGSQEAVKELINNGYDVYLINGEPTESFTFSKIDSNNIVCKPTLLESYFSCIVDSGCSSEECIIVDNGLLPILEFYI